MDASREALYKKIATQIGKTPLYEIRQIAVPNGNRIFAKEEYLNPTGSHYDRVFLKLLYGLEKEGRISLGQELVETTSGNAGASFAWLCSVLGYKATVLIPEDMPAARFAQIKSFGAELVFSPKGEYVAGVIEHLKVYLKERKSHENHVYFTNHPESEHSIEGTEEAGREIVQDLDRKGIHNVDFFISALGGGINLRGIANVLLKRWPNLKIVGVEPFEAPDNYVRRFPGRFEATYGTQPRFSPHSLLGIGRWGSRVYKFPHIEKMLERIDEIILIKAEEWQDINLKLRNLEAKHVGRTSAASASAALKLAKEVQKKVFVSIFYDPAWKYLNIA